MQEIIWENTAGGSWRGDPPGGVRKGDQPDAGRSGRRLLLFAAGLFVLFLMLWARPQPVRALTFPSSELYTAGKGGWVKQRLGYYAWKKADGTYITKAGFYELNGKIYFICGNSGRCYTGWLSYANRRYYMDPDTGIRTTGWLELDTKKYYMDPTDGYLHTGFTKVGNYYYYFCNQGYMLTGWRTFNNARYYFYSRTGAMVRGWLSWRGNMYYFTAAGKLVTNQEAYVIGSRTYSIDDTGICTEVFTVEFCTYNGGAFKKYSVKAGDSVAVPAMPKLPGYTFIGWSTQRYCFVTASGGANIAYEMGEEIPSVHGNLKFYAALFNYRTEPKLTTGTMHTPNSTKYDALIMVGDSRTVHLKQALELRTDYLKKYPNLYFIAASGQRLPWLQQYGAAELLELVTSLKEQGKEKIAVVFNLGVNSLRGENIDFSEYVPYMEYLGTEIETIDPLASLFYMSVNPVNPAQQEAYYQQMGMSLTLCDPKAVLMFNATIRARLAPQFTYLDTYSYLAGTGYSTEDGLHYTTYTSLRYFDYMVQLLNAA